MVRLELATGAYIQWPPNCHTPSAFSSEGEFSAFILTAPHLTFQNGKIAEINIFMIFCVGHHDTKRARPTPTPARSGESNKLRNLQDKARREVDLSSSYLEYNLKPGLNRSLRPLSCQGQHIYTCLFPNPTPTQSRLVHRKRAIGLYLLG